MDNNKLTMYIIFTILFSILFMPMQALAVYQFSDDFTGAKFDIEWLASPSSHFNDIQRGDWTIRYAPNYGNKPLATTENNKSSTILYRRSHATNIFAVKNYQVTATISVEDNDSLGVVFYYKDDSNYYRLTINNSKLGDNSDDEYPHSIYLIKREGGYDQLLAIAPLPGTHYPVKDYIPITLRVKVITGPQNYILPQYYNPSIGEYVNLFDKVIIDNNLLAYGFAGVYASYMGGFFAGNLHHINVEPIANIIDILPANLPGDDSDLYLLDYRDNDGNYEEIEQLAYLQYTPIGITPHGTGDPMYWFLGDEDADQDGHPDNEATYNDSTKAGIAADITIPIGKHIVYLYDDPERTNPAVAKKEVWVSSESAFTIAVMPDLHIKNSETCLRNQQVRGIMSEIKKRKDEDNIKASIQVGDIAVRGFINQLKLAQQVYFPLLGDDMPLIAAIGNHDLVHSEELLYIDQPTDRYSMHPDHYIFPVVTDMVDGKVTNRIKTGHGVETPNEVDNMYFLFNEDYLGDGSGNWLVLSLEPDPMARDLFWAEKIIKKYGHYNVILVTHQFLDEYGKIDKNPIQTKDSCAPDCPLFTGANSGEQVWNFLKKHDQIKIILDGHTSAKGGLPTRTLYNISGVQSLAMTTDVSYTHHKEGAGGQFRLLEIDPGQNMIRGRLVYARTHKHLPSGDQYSGQAINATHSDVYFIESGIDLSNTNCPNILLFEDFNNGPIYSDNNGYPYFNHGLPPDWIAFNDAGPASFWQVDFTNDIDSPEDSCSEAEKPACDYWSNETNVRIKMAKFGRVQQTKNTHKCENLMGTYLLYDNQYAKENWSNYIFELDLSPGDDDGIGVMFYYTDENHYYRFSMFEQAHPSCGIPGNTYFLEKIYVDDQGETQTVELLRGNLEKNNPYKLHSPYKVVVDLSEEGLIQIDIFDQYAFDQFPFPANGNFIHEEVYDDTFTHGSIGLYSWGMDNESGNQAGAIFDNVLVSTKTPLIPAPALKTLPVITGECSAKVTEIPTAIYRCGQITATTDDPYEYQGGGEYTKYTIRWKYDDGNGNIFFQPQTVILDDVIAPTPDAPTLSDITGECSVVVESKPTASDGCAGSITGTTSDLLMYDTPGTYIIKWTYDDGNGNTSYQQQNVIVTDTSPPTPDAPTLSDITGECSVVVESKPTASDGCAGSITGTTSDLLMYDTPGTYIIKWTYDDGNGNTSYQQQKIIVTDTSPPTPDTPTLPDINGECSVNVDNFPTAVDNCAGPLAATTNDPLEYNEKGTYTITWIFDDGNGNTTSQTQTVIVRDTTPPEVLEISPSSGLAVQDGVLLTATVSDNCKVEEVRFSIREPGGAYGTPIGYEDLDGVFNDASGKWEYHFDTTQLLDGYYVLFVKAVDIDNNEGVLASSFSIRNWAVIELLPASNTYRAGRTMPVKFSLRIVAAVDPTQPFVYNEDLEIRIYDEKDNLLLQTSIYGDTSTNYRINVEAEHYITNFKTSKKPAEYRVEVRRIRNDFLIGDFKFQTVRK